MLSSNKSKSKLKSFVFFLNIEGIFSYIFLFFKKGNEDVYISSLIIIF